MNRLKLLPILLISALAIISCLTDIAVKLVKSSAVDSVMSEPYEEQELKTFTDSRDGHEYRTVKVGGLVWMADNLKYKVGGDSVSWCFNSDCEKYGMLYHWEAANNVCPSGWHLPSIYEWHNLDEAVFLPADGYCDDISRYDMFVYDGWWTSTKAGNGIYLYIPKPKDHIAPGDINAGDIARMGCSVRCVQDNERFVSFIPDSSNAAKSAFGAPLPYPSDSADSVRISKSKYLDSLDLQMQKEYKTHTEWCMSVDRDISELKRFSKNDSITLRHLTRNYNVSCARPAEIAKFWAYSQEKKYEIEFNEALERIIKTMPEATPEIKSELKKTKAEYEKTFKRLAPWWWMCSEEENLERLKKAINTKTPYLDYSYGLQAFKVGVNMAKYEMRFKKLPPEWDCSDEERLERLRKAIEIDMPYFTKEEEDSLAANFKMEYQKRFGAPATDAEISTKSVRFEHEIIEFLYGRKNPVISVTKTATGAVAKYELPTVSKDSEIYEAKLSMEEWLDFINSIYKCCIDDWKVTIDEWNKRKNEGRSWHNRIRNDWHLDILHSDNKELKLSATYEFPENFNEFLEIINKMKARAASELEAEIKTEYEKRFGKPITAQELSTEEVVFYTKAERLAVTPYESYTAITRTKNGATVRYLGAGWQKVELSKDEWLDFINALYKTSFDKMEREYYKGRRGFNNYDAWTLKVHHSDSIKPDKFSGTNKYPPNWDKITKVLHGIREKVKKDSATRELEAKLKTEYQKRFGTPITNLELFAQNIEFYIFSRALDGRVIVDIDRTANGVHIEYNAGNLKLLDAELTQNEWLDFLNNSMKRCPASGNYWDNNVCCRKNKNDFNSLVPAPAWWRLSVVSSDKEADVFGFKSDDICLPKWDEFMKVVESKKR